MERSTFELDRYFVPLEPPLSAADWPAIRLAYSDLMDRAAIVIQRRGLDQDDCFVDRLAWIHHQDGHAPLEILIEGLASMESLWHPYCRAAKIPAFDEDARRAMQLTAIGYRIRIEHGVAQRHGIGE